MVFVPGTSVYALLYVEYMYKLSREGFNVVGLDPRGHGMSSGRRGVYTLSQLVEDALATVCHNVIAPDEPDNERMTRWPGFYRPLLALARSSPMQAALRTPLGRLMIPVRAYLNLKGEPCRLFPDVMRFLGEDPLAVNAVSLSFPASLGASPLAVRAEEIGTPIVVVRYGRDYISPGTMSAAFATGWPARRNSSTLQTVPIS